MLSWLTQNCTKDLVLGTKGNHSRTEACYLIVWQILVFWAGGSQEPIGSVPRNVKILSRHPSLWGLARPIVCWVQNRHEGLTHYCQQLNRRSPSVGVTETSWPLSVQDGHAIFICFRFSTDFVLLYHNISWFVLTLAADIEACWMRADLGRHF